MSPLDAIFFIYMGGACFFAGVITMITLHQDVESGERHSVPEIVGIALVAGLLWLPLLMWAEWRDREP